FHLGLIHGRINWLGDPDLAIISVMIVNVWRGVPFYAISLLAGLQTISPELHEAAAIDGARAWQRFRHITWPLLLPVTMVIVLFSVIQTFADFQLVYVLTGGGPANHTHLFATYAYQIGIGTGLLSEGAAVSLAIFPVLLLVVIIQLLYIRRVETVCEREWNDIARISPTQNSHPGAGRDPPFRTLALPKLAGPSRRAGSLGVPR